MDILHLLDRLEAVLSSGSRIPLSGKTLVDEHECLDIMDQLRVAVPEEVKQARRLQAERERLLEEAESQASRIVAHAQEQATAMAQQHEIARAAEIRASRIIGDAEAEAEERKVGADRYAMEALTALESRLVELLTVVQNGMQSLSRDAHDQGTMKAQ